jgi:hypothetical protein
VGFECHCQLDARLDAVAVECEQDCSRFTGLRREVLGLVLRADGPVGTYGLLDRLRLRRAAAYGLPGTVLPSGEQSDSQGRAAPQLIVSHDLFDEIRSRGILIATDGRELVP